jgi:hypothetical protein
VATPRELPRLPCLFKTSARRIKPGAMRSTAATVDPGVGGRAVPVDTEPMATMRIEVHLGRPTDCLQAEYSERLFCTSTSASLVAAARNNGGRPKLSARRRRSHARSGTGSSPLLPCQSCATVRCVTAVRHSAPGVLPAARRTRRGSPQLPR